MENNNNNRATNVGDEEAKKAQEAQEKKEAHDEYMNSKSAKIKNIYIELPGYEYFHSPSGVSRKDKRLIGRKAVKERLQTILKNSKTKAGAYLVTGYRGMGKTSLVRDIIAGIKEDGQKPRPEWVVLEIWFIMILINLFGVQLGHFLDNYIQGGSAFVKEVKNLPMALGVVWFIFGISFYRFSLQAKEWANMPNPPMSFFSRFSVTRRQEFFHEWWMWVWPKSSSEQVLAVETSLSQDEIREMDFLRLLTKNLAKVYGDFCKPLFSFLNSLRWVRNILIWALVFLCIYPEIYKYYVTLPIPGWARIILDPTFPLFSFFLFSFLVVGLRGYLSRILCKIGFTTQGEIRDRLQSLISKIDATVTMEQHQQVSPTAAPVNLFQFSRRQTQEFQIAGIKEIEFGLIDILDGIDKIWSPGGYKPKFICVFDELDKIQMDLSPNAANQEMDDDPSLVDRNYPIRRLRERRERISNILANLKHFLNVAKAKFVFIAGREMFDASLADISDRDFFLGSIFHEIIYVESFLKDRINSQSFGLTNMFEHYLCRFLIGYDSAKEEGKQKKGEQKEGKLNLKNYYDTFKKGNESKGEINKDLRKAISTLQDFVIFLVYRSNGTPKKITSLFEKYIKEIPLVAEKGKEDKMIPKGSNPNRDIIIKSPKKEAGSSKSFFLYFGHNDQYQFALISYLFRPYLISGSQYMKLFGDKLLFSTAFLVDHLFKFHPWAFSWRTLELTPEIVFASKSPQLRAFIGTLMKSLLRSHIREVVYGVFEFKFYNKTRHEISFISKINEGESAAFNFTLDESKHIKTHFQNRLRKRIQQYKDHPARKEGDYFQSLSFLHATLGDIFFYDQEFDEALLAYSDAVAIYGLDFPRKFSPHQLTNWMKDRLKMALTYERMHSNNDALSIYEGILMDLDTLFGLNTRHGVTKKAQKGQAGFAKALFENLRFFQLPFVAKLVMIEKEGISGISYLDIVQVEKRMRRLLQLCLRANQASTRGVFTPVGRSVESQEYLVRTYYHLNVGAVLYFKNGTVIHAREELRENDEKLWKHLSNYLFSGTGGPATESSSFIAPRSATMEYYKAFLFLIARLQAFSPQRTPLINAKQNPDSSEVEEGAFDWISDLINEKINKLNGKIASKEKEVENLKEEINQLDIKTASNKDKVENLYEAIASIKVENLKEEIASKEKEVEKLKEEITSEKEVEKLKEEIASKEKEVEKLKEEINKLNGKIVSNKYKFGKLFKAITSNKDKNLKEEIASNKDKVEKLKEEINKLKDKVEKLNGEIASNKDKVEKLNGEITSNKDKAENLNVEIASNKDKVEKLNGEIASNKDKVEKLKEEIASKEKEVKNISFQKVIFGRILNQIKENTSKPKNPFYLFIACGVWFYLLKPTETRYINQDKNLLSTLSLIFSKLGDVLLCYIEKESKFNLSKWQYLFDVKAVLLGKEPDMEDSFQEDADGDFLIHWDEQDNGDMIYLVAFFYLLSAMFYRKAGKHQNHEFQLRKILYLIKDYVSVGADFSVLKNVEAKYFCDLIKKQLIRPSLKSISKAGEITNRPQTLKYKALFSIEEETEDYQSKWLYNYLSNSPDTREITMLMAEIELKLLDKGSGTLALNDLSFSLSNNFVNPYTQLSTKFVRMQELLFKAQCNFALLFEVGDEINPKREKASKLAKSIIKQYLNHKKDTDSRFRPAVLCAHFHIEEETSNNDTIERNIFLETLLADSVFCLMETTNILEVFGINYMTGHTYRGYTHQKLADWCLLYQAYLVKLKKDDKKSFQKQLMEITQASNIAYLEPKYHYELALMHFGLAIEMHNNGKVYFEQIQEMHFLEDDFNDNMYHFAAALERYKINIGAIHKKIVQMKGFTNVSKVFNYDSYINKEEHK